MKEERVACRERDPQRDTNNHKYVHTNVVAFHSMNLVHPQFVYTNNKIYCMQFQVLS